MALRDPLQTEIEDPPAGTVRIAFWRHVSQLSEGPDLDALHQGRAVLVHELVEETGLDVDDWGDVDSERPSEVTQMLIEQLTSATIGVLVPYLFAKIRRRRGEETEALMAVTLRRPDGSEIVWDFRRGVTAEQAAEELRKFSEGLPVDRLLGS